VCGGVCVWGGGGQEGPKAGRQDERAKERATREERGRDRGRIRERERERDKEIEETREGGREEERKRGRMWEMWESERGREVGRGREGERERDKKCMYNTTGTQMHTNSDTDIPIDAQINMDACTHFVAHLLFTAVESDLIDLAEIGVPQRLPVLLSNEPWPNMHTLKVWKTFID